ncbi:hypothetical protein KUV81_16790 [Ferrimonas balearica]|nr:hypothetical protein [Ferrimonas balearica]
MAALPASEARARARQDDRAWQPPSAAPARPAAPAADTTELNQLKAENRRLSEQLQQQGRESEQVERLRSELATSVDELAAMLEQNERLKRRLDALNQEMTMLQSALDEQQTINQQLEQQLEQGAPMPGAAVPATPDSVVSEPVVTEPEPAPTPDFWQSLLSNPWLLTLGAVIPALGLLLLLFAWLRRRNDQEAEAYQSELQDQDSVLSDEPLVPEEHNDGTLEKPDLDAELNLGEIQLDPSMEEPEGQSLSELLREQESARADVDMDSHLLTEDALEDLLTDPEPTPEQPTEPEITAAESETEAVPEAVSPEPEPQSAPEPTPIAAAAQPVTPAAPEEPFIDIDKLLEESEGEVEVAYPGVSFEMEGSPESTEVIEDESAINAKLDLARAYIEIEDHDSARALLKEVAFDGNEQQKNEANSLLEQL